MSRNHGITNNLGYCLVSIIGNMKGIIMLRTMCVVFAMGGILGVPNISHAHPKTPNKLEQKKKHDEKYAAELERKVGDQARCLAQVIYYEIRGGGAKGRIAVAQTVMHRVGNPEFGNTICEVIHRKDYNKAARKWVYQYPWSRHMPKKRETDLWIESLQLASALMDPDSGIEDLVTIKTPKGNLVGTYFNDAIYHIRLDNNLVKIACYDGMNIYAPKQVVQDPEQIRPKIKPTIDTQVVQLPDDMPSEAQGPQMPDQKSWMDAILDYVKSK